MVLLHVIQAGTAQRIWKVGGGADTIVANVPCLKILSYVISHSDPEHGTLFYLFKMSYHCWNAYSNYKLEYKLVQKA